MNGSTRWGGGCPMSHGRGEQQVDMPLIPAPVAFFAMMFGLMIGIMIGRKKSTMHGMGMGGKCGGDWMMRKKMMGKMGMPHHHHGYGMPECRCGEGSQAAGEDEEGTAGDA